MLTTPARRLIATTQSSLRLWNASGGEPKSQIQSYGRRSTMFDVPITLALFAAFLLGIVAGSGLEILVRAGRY